MITVIYLAFNNTYFLVITVCKAPFHYPTKGLNRSRYSNRALGKLYPKPINTTLLLSDKKIGGNTIYHSINFPPSPS